MQLSFLFLFDDGLGKYNKIKKIHLKPNLKLTTQKLLNEKTYKSKKFATELKADLISLLQFLIANKETLKIDLNCYQEIKPCGTYRCVAGWWAYWLGVPVKDGNITTDSFDKIFCSYKIFRSFVNNVKYSSLKEIDYHSMIFGDVLKGNLYERLSKVESLEV